MKLKLNKYKKTIFTFLGLYFIIEIFKRYYFNKGKTYQKLNQLKKSNEKSKNIKKYTKETNEIINNVPSDKLDEFM